MPEQIKPMLATPSRRAPEGPGWAAEIKWDGARAITYCHGGRTRLESRLGNDLGGRFPELLDLAREAPAPELVLDGEIVCFDEAGRPRFGVLQKRLQRVGRFGDEYDPGLEDLPAATYLIFDLLFIDGRSTLSLSYRERREILEGLELSGPSWRTPPRLEGDIPGLLAASREGGLEGLVVKRESSLYRPGKRSRDWLKLKNFRRTEFVVGGWTPGAGGRAGTLGAILVGAWLRDEEDGAPRLHYAGRVGTGFDAEWLDRLVEALEPLRRPDSPFAPVARKELGPPRGSIFVEPELVAEVEYGEITADGILRHSVFKGLREDKSADEVFWQEPPA